MDEPHSGGATDAGSDCNLRAEQPRRNQEGPPRPGAQRCRGRRDVCNGDLRGGGGRAYCNSGKRLKGTCGFVKGAPRPVVFIGSFCVLGSITSMCDFALPFPLSCFILHQMLRKASWAEFMMASPSSLSFPSFLLLMALIIPVAALLAGRVSPREVQVPDAGEVTPSSDALASSSTRYSSLSCATPSLLPNPGDSDCAGPREL